VGTGQWESAIIEPLHKELRTHHILIMFQNLNDGPAELYLDDAFYCKGDLPAAKPNPASPFIRREAQKVCDHLQNLAAVSKEDLARLPHVLDASEDVKRGGQCIEGPVAMVVLEEGIETGGRFPNAGERSFGEDREDIPHAGVAARFAGCGGRWVGRSCVGVQCANGGRHDEVGKERGSFHGL